MAETNTYIIIIISITIILLLACMVLSAMASSAAEECTGCTNNKAKDYSMYTAIITGISAFLMGICLYFYVYRSEIAGAASGVLIEQLVNMYKHSEKIFMFWNKRNYSLIYNTYFKITCLLENKSFIPEHKLSLY